MIDIQLPIRSTYYGRLAGNVTYGGKTLDVKDSFAEEFDEMPYIILTDQIVTPDTQGRCRFVHQATQGMEIVFGYQSGVTGGREDTERVANIIYPLVGLSKNSADWLDFGSGLFNGATQLDFSSYLSETRIVNGAKIYIYRKLLRFRHLISQN